MAVDLSKIVFPCMGEVKLKGEQFWQPCLVIGLFQQGSATSPASRLVLSYVVVDTKGDHHDVSINQVRYLNFHIDA